jgi:hypothetical protein
MKKRRYFKFAGGALLKTRAPGQQARGNFAAFKFRARINACEIYRVRNDEDKQKVCSRSPAGGVMTALEHTNRSPGVEKK